MCSLNFVVRVNAYSSRCDSSDNFSFFHSPSLPRQHVSIFPAPLFCTVHPILLRCRVDHPQTSALPQNKNIGEHRRRATSQCFLLISVLLFSLPKKKRFLAVVLLRYFCCDCVSHKKRNEYRNYSLYYFLFSLSIPPINDAQVSFSGFLSLLSFFNTPTPLYAAAAHSHSSFDWLNNSTAGAGKGALHFHLFRKLLPLSFFLLLLPP